jgi:hypothetical protein
MSKDKKPLQSKKFIALVVGVSTTALFTLLGLLVIGLVPSASSAVVNLMTISLASINGVMGLYVSGQSFVDWKINSNHNTSQENKIIDEKKTLVLKGKEHEFKYDDLDNLDWNDVDPDDIKKSGLNFNFNFDKNE